MRTDRPGGLRRRMIEKNDAGKGYTKSDQKGTGKGDETLNQKGADKGRGGEDEQKEAESDGEVG